MTTKTKKRIRGTGRKEVYSMATLHYKVLYRFFFNHVLRILRTCLARLGGIVKDREKYGDDAGSVRTGSVRNDDDTYKRTQRLVNQERERRQEKLCTFIRRRALAAWGKLD